MPTAPRLTRHRPGTTPPEYGRPGVALVVEDRATGLVAVMIGDTPVTLPDLDAAARAAHATVLIVADPE